MTNTREINVNALVGELVHQYMWRNKVTQTAIANALGVGQPAIARKLRGERPFSIDELMAVAAYLDLPITDLLPNAENPRPGGPDGGDETSERTTRQGPNANSGSCYISRPILSAVA